MMEDNKHTTADGEAQASAFDMAVLVRRIREYLEVHSTKLKHYPDPLPHDSLVSRFGFTDRRKGKPEIVLAEEVAVELGHPNTASRCILLLTRNADLVRNGVISVLGPDLDDRQADKQRPLAQVIMLALEASATADPFDMENAQYLINRLPGYMVRSVPGRLWVRVSRDSREKGLGLHTVGSALISTYTREFEGVEKAEVLFITAGKEEVEELAVLSAEAEIMAGRHKKVVLGMDGEAECAELDCDDCDEQPVCDNLRDVVIKRRRNRDERTR